MSSNGGTWIRTIDSPDMHVLIVMPLAEQRGGGELMLIHLLRHVRPGQDHLKVVFLEDGPLANEFDRMGHDVLVIRAGRLRQLHRYLATVRLLARLSRRADVVWSWMPKAHLYASPAAMLAGRPAVWNQLGIPRETAWMDRLATALPAAGVIVLSSAAMEAQARLWPHRPLRLAHPGAELDEFDATRLPDRNSVRAKLGLPVGARVIGMVARLQRWKGIHIVIEAMPQVLAAYPDAELVIVGGEHSLEPGYAHELRELVASLGLDGQVRLVGLQHNIPEWMHAVDLVVMASWDEPFGIVVIEAMALGRPVIVSDSGGPAEIVTPWIDGMTFRTGDSESLANVLVDALGHPERAQEIGRNASVRARAFSAHAYAHAAIKAVRELTYEAGGRR